MEASNEFNNQTLQTEEYIVCINDEIKINQVREESENPSLQIEVSKVLGEFNEEKTK
jgi:REP element-mobilizing transposase RayT